MEKAATVFALLFIVLITELHVSMAQCTCSCSSMESNQDVCEKSNPPSDVSDILLIYPLTALPDIFGMNLNMVQKIE